MSEFPQLDALVYWAIEREAMRRRREAGALPPWSADPILSAYRFCNADVQDDRVSRVIFDIITQPYAEHPGLIVGLAVCRFTNAPEVIEAVKDCVVPFDAERFGAIMADRKARGLPLERRAYVIPGGTPGEPKAASLTRDLFTPLSNAIESIRPKPGDTCNGVFKRLGAFPYLSGFLGAQIIRDLKQVEPLRSAPDWKTFVQSGPGSQRGVNRVCGATTAAEIERERPEAEWRELFEEIVELAAPRVAEHGIELDAQSWQNVFCETDKFLRFRSGDMGGARRYAPGGKAPPRKAKPKPAEAPPAIAPLVKTPHALPELAAARDPNAPHILFHDLETRSPADLRAVGGWKYANDASTEVLCMAYAVDDEPVQLWTPGDPVPSEFIEASNNQNWRVVAHNDAFERFIYRHVLKLRHGFPSIPVDRRRCSMAMASAASLPAALDKAAATLGLPLRKDKAGQALMRRMTKPLPGGAWIEDAASREQLYAYCRQDVETERALFRALPPLSGDEQALWEIDARISERGFAVDRDLLDAADEVVTAATAALQEEFAALTGLTNTNQVEKFVAWLGEHGCEVSDVQKKTLKAALRRKNLTPAVRRAVELRLELAHASAAKVKALLAWCGSDNRVRGTFRFHGAATGRWTGHGPQPQNFKRDGDGIDAKIAAIMAGGAGLASPVEAVGDIARAMICAAPRHRLMIGDFSGIESRVLAWISGQQSKLDQWARFDISGALQDDPYFILGRSCGQPEQIARAIGKIADLAFGYMGGPGAWDRLAPEDDDSTEDDKRRYQRTWREVHPHTVRFWRGIDRAAIAAVRQPGTPFSYGRSLAFYDDKFLRLTLPSGRALSYPFPREEAGKYGDPMIVFKDNAAGKFVDCRYGQGAYGGLWTENIVQAVARDLLAAAMLRLEAAGYPVVLHVHDEIVAELPTGTGSVEEFQRIITALADWAEGLPVAAKVRESERFSKPEAADAAAESQSDEAATEPNAAADDDALAEILDAAAVSQTFSAPAPGNVAASRDEFDQGPRNSSMISKSALAADAILGSDEPVDEPKTKRAKSNGAGNGFDHGSSGKILCPFHDDRTPSLQIYPSEDDPHYHCFACGAHGHLDDLLIDWASVPLSAKQTEADAARLERGLALWAEAKPIVGTLAEKYLAEVRGIDVAALPSDIDAVLRFHRRCAFGGEPVPCLVALFRDVVTDAPAGIHRIGLRADGSKIGRMTLGRWSTPRAIKLWPAGKQLFLGEGVETVLAAATRIQDRGQPMRPAWAAGSSGNVAKFPIVPAIEELNLLVDRGSAGEQAAATCGLTWKVAGRRVRRLRTQNAALNDFNDLARAQLQVTP